MSRSIAVLLLFAVVFVMGCEDPRDMLTEEEKNGGSNRAPISLGL